MVSIASLEDTAARLGSIIQEFESLDIHLPTSSRLYHHRQIIEESIPAIRIRDPAGEQLQHLGQALRDVEELYLILTTLCNVDSSGLPPVQEKLRELLSGCVLARDDQNPLARNIQYELFIAALFSKLGFLVDLREPDIWCKYQDEEFCIAAKRMKSKRQVHSRLVEADKQIEDQGVPGVIALGVEQISNPEHSPLMLEECKTVPEQRLELFTEQYSEDLLSTGTKTVGVILTFWAWALSRGIANLPSQSVMYIGHQLISVGWTFRFVRTTPSHNGIVEAVNFVLTHSDHLRI